MGALLSFWYKDIIPILNLKDKLNLLNEILYINIISETIRLLSLGVQFNVTIDLRAKNALNTLR